MKQRNRTESRFSGAALDWWEAQYFVGKERIRRYAKKLAKRARRRLDRMLERE